MVVMILESSALGEGELSRWLIQVRSGIQWSCFGRVRDMLWEKCCIKRKAGSIFRPEYK